MYIIVLGGGGGLLYIGFCIMGGGGEKNFVLGLIIIGCFGGGGIIIGCLFGGFIICGLGIIIGGGIGLFWVDIVGCCGCCWIGWGVCEGLILEYVFFFNFLMLYFLIFVLVLL